MSLVIDGKPKRIGLAMSGGGFRAAAFHLGVMRQLQTLGLLDKLDLLSCVSGGSIAGATVATHWSDPGKLDLLDTYLRTRSIAVSSFIAGSLDPFASRLDKLASSYDDDLFHKKTLSALSNGPRLYLNATNLATGNLFFFVTGGGGLAELGEHELGVEPGPNFALRLDADDYSPAGVEYVTLTDGGIYDNMGVNPLLRDRNALDYIIVSDGGKPFANSSQPTESGAIVLKAALDIMMEQIRGLEFDRLQYRHLAGKGPKPMWFSIDSREGQAQEGDAAFASAIDTNLRKLSSEEMSVLTRHGAALVHARLKTYAPELLTA
jgi:NTE family protein